ncbi:MAG: S41 family peptidase, partial [Candidatus Colwellbacteria bacterium]|nr:S41 family peptidase [Candidatus Colwellbacteria bacterium]
MRRLFIRVAIFAFFALAAGGGYYAGYEKGIAMPRVIEIKGIADINPNAEVKADFGVFWQAWDQLKSKFVGASKLDDQTMVYGAIAGLAESLDDPYTAFFNPEDARKFNEDVKGEFGGIGAELEEQNRQIVIVAPLKTTPAERAGLKPKDIILKVDDEELKGITVADAVKIIRGEPGTRVKLLVQREGLMKPKEFEIVREIIRIPTLEWEVKTLSPERGGGEILYLDLRSFNQNTLPLLYRALAEGLPHNPRGIILDLRNNPGGYLDVAVRVAGLFIPGGEPVVIERMGSGSETTLRSPGTGILKNIPVVAVVNGGSASAAEILAGALRDRRGALLVGEKTFGKGTVQELQN